MNKRLVFGAVVLVLVLVTGIALYYAWPQNSSPEPLNQSQKDIYLRFGEKNVQYLHGQL